jgi:hypothetical protein
MADAITGEDLLRNVAVGHLDEASPEPNPAAIWPRAEDKNRLSTDRMAIWSAEDSYRFRVEVLDLKSRGVMVIGTDDLRVGWEIETQSAPLVAGVDDAPADNPAHALSDLTHLIEGKTKAQRRRTREAILAKALERGWVYGPVFD